MTKNTNTRRLSYQTAAAREKRQPIEVTIDDVTLRFRSSLPLPDLMQVAELASLGDEDDPSLSPHSFSSVLDTLEMLLVPDSVDAWRAKLADPDAPIDIAVLVALLTDLVPMLVGRPTEESSSSDGS